MPARRGAAEIRVEGRDPVDLGPAEVQCLGHNRQGGVGDMPETVLDLVQDRHQRPFKAAQPLDDIADPFRAERLVT